LLGRIAFGFANADGAGRMNATKKDIESLADYLGCNAAELWSELHPMFEAEYRHGYNDNARDCFCEDFKLAPHHHLLDDGVSHNIKPDIRGAK
jgi:hypothetical protein